MGKDIKYTIYFKWIFQNVSDNLEIQLDAFLFCCFGANELRCIIYVLLQVSETLKFSWFWILKWNFYTSLFFISYSLFSGNLCIPKLQKLAVDENLQTGRIVNKDKSWCRPGIMQQPIIEQHFIETLQNSRILRYPKSTLMLHYYSFQFLLLFLPFFPPLSFRSSGRDTFFFNCCYSYAVIHFSCQIHINVQYCISQYKFPARVTPLL